MKNYLIAILALGTFFVSCKKERVCSCSVSTTGTTTTHSQGAGVSFSLSIGLPLPVPPVEISPAKDTTIVVPFSYADTHKTTYNKVSKKAIRNACPSSFEETITDGSTTIIPGTSTVTVSKSGRKAYTCKIE